jgi:hypothetical protein
MHVLESATSVPKWPCIGTGEVLGSVVVVAMNYKLPVRDSGNDSRCYGDSERVCKEGKPNISSSWRPRVWIPKLRSFCKDEHAQHILKGKTPAPRICSSIFYQ